MTELQKRLQKVVDSMPEPKAKVRSTKWYGWFWPPERRKVRVIQAIADHYAEDINNKVAHELKQYLLYGKRAAPKSNVGDK